MKPAEFLFENAIMQMRLRDREGAAQMLAEVLRLQPNHADAWALRARLEADSGRPFNAMLHHGFATAIAPDRYDFWCNRGIDAMAAHMLKESQESFEKSLSIRETYEAHFNYGNLLSAQMRIDEAVAHFKAAEKIGGPAEPQIYANLGTTMIGQGKWREGFGYYRHRFNAPGFPPRPRFTYPIWHGEPIAGKTILLYVEQGFGDEILSYRFASSVKAAGARVILSVRPPMFRLARSLLALDPRPVDAVMIQYDDPPWPPDYMSALLDVPACLDITPETVPLTGGYLRPTDQGFKLQMPEGFNVGFCWASGNRPNQPAVFETAKQKSLTLEKFLPLRRDGVNLFSLQKEHQYRLKADYGIRDPLIGTADFEDTAFIMDYLDLIITVDTSVAHLAGAMGKPVWNLVRFDALWPWMQENGKTCWYDSMTVYRQPEPFNWDEPIKRVMADFDKLVETRQAKAA